MSVVLPEPFAPTTSQRSWRSTVKFTSFTMVVPSLTTVIPDSARLATIGEGYDNDSGRGE